MILALAIAVAATNGSPNLVVVKFDRTRSWPDHLVVQRGSILRLEGPVQSGLDTTFTIRADGTPIALTTGNKSWAAEWDTAPLKIGHVTLSVFWRQRLTEENELASIDVDMLDESPFSAATDGQMPNGDVLVRVKSPYGMEASKLSVSTDGRTLFLKSRPDGRFLIPVSGVVPGPHEAKLTAMIPTGGLFEAGKISFAVAAKTSFKDPAPIEIHRTLDSLGDIARVDCTFETGFNPKTIDFNLGQSATWIAKEQGGQLLLNCDSLPEGDHDLSIKAVGYDGTVYLSSPKKLHVRSDDSYVRYRVLSTCGPEFQDASYSLQSAFKAAADAEIVTADVSSAEKAFDAWSQAAAQANDLVTGTVPMPDGLANADKQKTLPGLNHAFQNWMTYGRLFAQSMADSWAPLELGGGFVKTSKQVQAHFQSLAQAEQALRDAANAQQNLVIAYRRLGDGLDVHPLEPADAFGAWAKLKDREDRRLPMLKWLASVVTRMSNALNGDSDLINSEASEIRSLPIDPVFPEGDHSLITDILEQCSRALQEESLARQYRDQRQRLLAQLPEEPTNDDQAKLKRFDDLIELANDTRESELRKGFDALAKLVTKDNLALVARP